ncbi:glycosyltransferase [Collinsella tanakaei]|nr:glycosyltransferase [Collinsella tanakaei]
MFQLDNRMESPLVTIVVPVYNLGRLAIPCLISLRTQTYSNLEIIVVDDGSTDDSLAICTETAADDSRVRVTHKENGGLSTARNFGLKKATGDYVMFVDGDDLLDCRAVEHLLTLAQETRVQLVACQYKKIRPVECFDGGLLGTYKLVSGEEQLGKMLLLRGESGSAWAKLYARELIPLLVFPEGQLFEDFGVEAKIFAAVERVCVTDAELYGYVTREESITTAKCYGDAHLEGMRQSIKKVREAVACAPSLADSMKCFEAFCSLRVASKLDISLCSNRIEASQYLARSRRLCRRAALSPLPTKAWRIRCALFSLSPKLHNFIYSLYGKVTGRVIG